MPENNITFGLTIHYADCCGNAKNCTYPHTATASTEDTIRKIVAHDHVLAEFKDAYRSKDNFVRAVVASMDCDNDHSENPNEWVAPKDIPHMFPNIPCVIVTSRNHMKPKGGKTPRPRFHVFLAIEPITDALAYAGFMKKVQNAFSVFDDNALDAARFFYGNPNAEVSIYQGTSTLTRFMEDMEAEQMFSELDAIPEGRRNSTMSKIAGKLLKRYGDNEESYRKFLDSAGQCTPPLDDAELSQIWRSAQGFYKKVQAQPGYVSPDEYASPQWEEPIPFEQRNLPSFPTEALPQTIKDYALAVAESTQTPVDMSACAALAVMALCLQGKYRIKAKADWSEPLNLFTVIVAEPSERKSPIINLMTKPLNEYEAEYNSRNAAELEASKMNKRILEKRQRALEDKAAKGKADSGELEQLARQIASYKERTPLRLYVDDITTEKLNSVLADGNGKAAIISAEGGIFDMLSGIYSKNVNIDVMLKGYSGDSIRVDRVGRNSESIMNPALTILLTVQPNVLSEVMQNGTFRGRGLTARFLYCMPTSLVGRRRFHTTPIPQEVSSSYERLIKNLLEDEQSATPEMITLSTEAEALLESFSDEVEGKLKTEFADIADWAGKLVGGVLRIAGILCRASVMRCYDFLSVNDALVVSEEVMKNAITIGRYFAEHSKAAFSRMGVDARMKQSKYVLSAIVKNGLAEFTRRDIMRLCRSFKTAEELQPILNHLTEYGYIAPKGDDAKFVKGRPTGQIYLVNPCVHQNVS